MSSSSPRKPAGKSRSSATAAAREQARLRREEQQKKDRRRRMLISIGAPVLIVILIVVGFVVVKANQKPVAATGSPSTALDAAAAKSLGSIPAATFDTVGAGSGVSAPTAVTGAALTADGKPRVVYIGAEYCPFCAAQRWAVVAALSRFGTFTGLGATTSSSIDSYPSTATVSFHGATYTSSLLSFTGVEETTNIPVDASDISKGYTPLETPTAADQALVTTYDSQTGSIPFVDFGNKYVTIGASYLPTALKGLTQTQIIADLQNPGSDVAKGALGAANMMTAVLCKMTGNQPAAACSSTAVTSQKLPA
ncbi:hypothetical protein ABIB25_003399 [Nakamurella sp. UYEF19]|uniref:DUF929 family protein n=1 Tax=Nakamurella sp. UYEF19 TaxID=1756392 RepID=UPI0033992C6B